MIAMTPTDAARPVTLDVLHPESPCIRAALNTTVVAEYAARMREGDVFPPVVIFVTVEGDHYLADGHHRVAAARQNGLTAVACERHTGTRADALWYALGANREHGARLTAVDQRHAIRLAIQTWPEKSNRDLEQHIGVAHQRLSEVRYQLAESGQLVPRTVGADGKTRPATRTRDAVHPKVADVEARIREGESYQTIASAVHVSRSLVAETRKRIDGAPPTAIDVSRAAVAARVERMRTLASEGYSTRQIAALVDVTESWCREHIRRAGIIVPADAIVGRSRRIDPNRIVAAMVMQAEHLCADVNLIEFAQLDGARLPAWVLSLERSRRALSAFITTLKEQIP